MDYSNYKSETLSLWDVELNERFHLIQQIVPENCSLLGYKLYYYANALFESESNVVHEIQNFVPIIELLIRAHDCFTTDCNMKGITLVLKKCQPLITIFVNLNEWRYVVRVFTGIRRYLEMKFVFQLLHENDQFEFLLRKEFVKDTHLKMALLEYLEKHCPYNQELYRMVALHFNLFSEVASIWEAEAESLIKNLVYLSEMDTECNKCASVYSYIIDNEDTKIQLQKVRIFLIIYFFYIL